jgi:hypothetical protein
LSRYSEFFLNSRSSVAQLELIEVSHPDFSGPHRFVRTPEPVGMWLVPASAIAEFEALPVQGWEVQGL